MRAAIFAALMAASSAQADVLLLAIGYAVGRSSAPGAPPPQPGAPLAAGTPKCFIQIGTMTVDAFQVVSITHAYMKSGYPCPKDQWHNAVGLANGKEVSACTIGNPQAQVFQALEKCK